MRAVFDPDEAEVLVTDDRVTVRLAGLSFPSGSADLGSDDAPLLTKLERVVRDFPGARITVEGHTDNVGDDATNLALSQRRAIAVRDYLLTGVAMSEFAGCATCCSTHGPTKSGYLKTKWTFI